jgi:hypothetical protein
LVATYPVLAGSNFKTLDDAFASRPVTTIRSPSLEPDFASSTETIGRSKGFFLNLKERVVVMSL